MKSYRKVIEELADLEHRQWWHWSKALSLDLMSIKNLVYHKKNDDAINTINRILKKWGKNWKPYNKLKAEIKEYDREWAEKAYIIVPIKCPMWQCGGVMTAVERAYPKGMNEDDFPDGMVGDSQCPDLKCTNCGAVYVLSNMDKLRGGKSNGKTKSK